MPMRFSPDTLRMLGVFGYRRGLSGQISTAHPHYDAKRACHYNYIADLGMRSLYRLCRIGDDGKQKVIAKLPVERPSYMHSFGMSEDHLVFTEFPLVVSPLPAWSATAKRCTSGRCHPCSAKGGFGAPLAKPPREDATRDVCNCANRWVRPGGACIFPAIASLSCSICKRRFSTNARPPILVKSPGEPGASERSDALDLGTSFHQCRTEFKAAPFASRRPAHDCKIGRQGGQHPTARCALGCVFALRCGGG